MALAVVVLTLAQFALLRYDLDAPLAEARSYWPNQAFLDLIEKNTGDVLTLHHYNYLRHATGRPMYPHFDSLGWILADRHPASVRFAQSFFEELRSGRFDTIIVSPLIGWFGDGSNFGYVCQTISGNQYPQGRYEIMRTRVFRPARDCKH